MSRRPTRRLERAALAAATLGALTLALAVLLISTVGQARSIATPRGEEPPRAAAGGLVGLEARERRIAGTSAGADVWVNAGCSGCHTLAGSGGELGPSLDETKPSFDRVVDVVTNGFGGMPAFGSDLTQTEIENVASYVAQTASRPARVARLGVLLAQRRARLVIARVRCVPAAQGRCTGSVVVRASVKTRLLRSTTATAKRRTVVLGKARFAIEAGNEKAVKIRFNRTGRRLLKKLGTKQLPRLRLTVKVTARDGSGYKTTASKKLTM